MGGDQERLSERIKPIIAMVMVDIGFGVGNVLMKQVLEDGLNSLVLITYRMVIGSLFLAPVSYFSERYIILRVGEKQSSILISSEIDMMLLVYVCAGASGQSSPFACWVASSLVRRSRKKLSTNSCINADTGGEG